MRDEVMSSIGLADLATNVLAVVVIAFALLSRLEGGGGDPGIRVTEADLVVRRTLTGREMVDHLVARRLGGDGSRLDVTARGVVLATGSATLALAPGAPLPDLSPPVRLYVLDNERYGPLARELQAAGVTASEINIPAALSDGAGDWSAGFKALISAPTSPDTFRDGLYALLAAGPEPTAGNGGGNPAAAAAPSAPTSIVERMLAALRIAGLLVMPLLGLLLVWRTERRLS